MAWNGTGTFVRTNGVFDGASVWANDRDAATKITAAHHDTHDYDLATGIDACLAKNGENAAGANLPMATYRHTNVGAAAALTDYARADQVQKGALCWAGTSTGSGGAYVASLTPAPSAYTTGMRVAFLTNHAQTTTATLNLNSLGAKNILRENAGALISGDLPTGTIVLLVYDGTQFLLLNPSHPKNLSTTAAMQWSAHDATTGEFTVSSASNYITLFENSSSGAHSITVEGNILLDHKTLTLPVTWTGNSAHNARFVTADSTDFTTSFTNSNAAVNHALSVQGPIAMADPANSAFFSWESDGADGQKFTVSNGSTITTSFMNSGAGDHRLTCEGYLTCDDAVWATNSGVYYLPKTISDDATAYFDFFCNNENGISDFINTGTGAAVLKVNGSTVALAFTGIHRYLMHADCTAKIGEPVKLKAGQVHHCEVAEDPACIGLLTGDVLVVTEPDYYDPVKKQKVISETKKNDYKNKVKLNDSAINYHPTSHQATSMGTQVLDGAVLYHVASTGDAVCEGLPGAKVCDEGGPVLAGDYLATATLKGYLKKYVPLTINDMRKVVAWAPEDIVFSGGKNDAAYVYLNR